MISISSSRIPLIANGCPVDEQKVIVYASEQKLVNRFALRSDLFTFDPAYLHCEVSTQRHLGGPR